MFYFYLYYNISQKFCQSLQPDNLFCLCVYWFRLFFGVLDVFFDAVSINLSVLKTLNVYNQAILLNEVCQFNL